MGSTRRDILAKGAAAMAMAASQRLFGQQTGKVYEAGSEFPSRGWRVCPPVPRSDSGS
jgi:hypothetical protein